MSVASTTVQAAPASSPVGAGPHASPNGLSTRLHKLAGTVIHWGSDNLAVAAEGVVIDGATVKCGNLEGCTIVVEAMAQVIADVGGQWSLCALVDGDFMPGGCPFQGVLPASTYTIANLRENAVVTTGTHTVQFMVYLPNAGHCTNWQADYHVYKN